MKIKDIYHLILLLGFSFGMLAGVIKQDYLMAIFFLLCFNRVEQEVK